MIAIAAGGAGVLNTVEHANDGVPDSVRWLLVASLPVALVSVATIARTLEIQRRLPEAGLVVWLKHTDTDAVVLD